MTRSELIEKLAARFPEHTQLDIRLSVLTLMQAMSAALASGDRIEIRGFGSFRSCERTAHAGRNPKTGEEVSIPARRILLFKPAEQMRERINRPSRPNLTGRHTRSTAPFTLQLPD